MLVKDKFIGISYRYTHKVAVFEQPTPGRKSFVLDREELVKRIEIKNVNKIDTTEEQKALVTIDTWENDDEITT